MVDQWVVLCYRVPREPSTPRIAVWRQLKRLGVAAVGDGVVALPADARTQEQLEWVAQDVEHAGGSTILWIAAPTAQEQVHALVEQMRQARTAEYDAITSAAASAATGEKASRVGVLRRLRAELRRVERRDYFPPPERDTARTAVRALTAAAGSSAAHAAPDVADDPASGSATKSGVPR